MGLFQQRPTEKEAWAAIPGEPLASDDAADTLDAPAADPFDIGLGAQYTSVVFPVAPPAPEATDVTVDNDPEDG